MSDGSAAAGRVAADPDNPSLFDALLADPTLEVPAEWRAIHVRDLRRWTRRYLKPWVRVVALWDLRLILAVKRVLPFQFRSHAALSVLGVWFTRAFASPEALALILRHFQVETNLINFVARNTGLPDVSLRPTRVEHLGDDRGMNAVVRHDVNLFNLVIGLARAPRFDPVRPRPVAQLDFGALEVAPVDAQPALRRLVALDLETVLYVMALAIALFLDEDEFERAVNSFQFDDSLLGAIAALTGDATFRTYTPVRFRLWLGMSRDPVRDLYWHFLVDEFAHTRLERLRDAARRAPSEGSTAP